MQTICFQNALLILTLNTFENHALLDGSNVYYSQNNQTWAMYGMRTYFEEGGKSAWDHETQWGFAQCMWGSNVGPIAYMRFSIVPIVVPRHGTTMRALRILLQATCSTMYPHIYKLNILNG